MEKRIEKTNFFNIDFCWIFHRFEPHFGGSWGGFGKLLVVQNGSQKGIINFFNKNVIFDGFGEGLERVLGEIWEGFGKDFGRFGRILRGLGALWTLLGLFAGFCVYF